jgi:hypothetical protein
MKAKRHIVCAGIFVACVALLLAVLVTMRSRNGVTKANYDRIKKGMTLAEVQEVFGGQGAVFYGFVNRRAYYWENEDRSNAIVLFHDDKNVVETAQWGDSTEGIGDRILRLIRWPWWK